MKRYDLQKAIKLIDIAASNLESASLGMHEDWGWTADEIFSDGEFKIESLTDETIIIAGISGSSWATPTLQLILKDGEEQMLPCWFIEGEEQSEEWKEQQKNFVQFGMGIFSSINQENITPLSPDPKI